MQDVSRVTGSPVLLTIGEKDYVLRGMSFEDLGTIQKKLVDDKRQRIIAAATDTVKQLGDAVPWPERRGILDDARKEASRTGFITDEELWDFVQTTEGSILLLWTCFERQYPGTFSRADLMKLLATGVLNEAAMKSLMAELIGGNEGNSTGQGTGAALASAAAPPATPAS